MAPELSLVVVLNHIYSQGVSRPIFVDYLLLPTTYRVYVSVPTRHEGHAPVTPYGTREPGSSYLSCTDPTALSEGCGDGGRVVTSLALGVSGRSFPVHLSNRPRDSSLCSTGPRRVRSFVVHNNS